MSDIPERGAVCPRCGVYSYSRNKVREHMAEMHGDTTSRPMRVRSKRGMKMYFLGKRL